MSIDAKQVKELRERTGAGILDCKKALTETDGDMDEAVDYLEREGIAAAKNKAGRIAAEGLVDTWIDTDRQEALLVEVNCETDFVARNDDFQAFVEAVTEAIGESDAESTDELDSVEVDGEPVPDAVNEQIATIGENINVRRFERKSNPNGTIGEYIHAGSQIGVLVNIDVDGDAKDDEVQEFARDIAMHVAAMNPPYLNRDDIPADDLEKQEEIFAEQMRDQGKPEDIIPQIVDGKIGKWASEVCLLEQPFVKDSDRTVKEVQNDIGDVEIIEFVRYEVGEGIETEEEDFSEEVAEQLDDA